jgi:hypothetical protein
MLSEMREHTQELEFRRGVWCAPALGLAAGVVRDRSRAVHPDSDG